MDTFEKFIEFLKEKGFQLLENKKDFKLIKYEKNGLFVETVQDIDSKRFISLSRANELYGKGWYDMNFIRFFILRSHYEKSQILTFEQLSEFFIENYNEIYEAFSDANFPDTEKELIALKKERVKVMFG